jgi:adenylate cyclase
MTPTWQLHIYERQQLVTEAEVDGPVELGRQSVGEDGPYALKRSDGGPWRLVIARLDENSVPRRYALVEPLEPGRARVTALHGNIAVQLQDGGEVESGEARDVNLPLHVLIGQRSVRIEEPAHEPVLESLAEATLAPGSLSLSPLSPLALAGRDDLELVAVVRWLRATMDVLQSAAASQAFFAQAARAVVDLIGLDTARVLLYEQGEWKPQPAQQGPDRTPEPDWKPSRRLLARLLREKRTFWQVPDVSGSLQGVKAVVAAPILNAQSQVIGALYGDRRHDAARVRPITRLEAMLVELLAGGVAAGLARLEQEQAALRARVQFEQFFTRELSSQLAREPDMLRGRDEEVTVLFSDIRAFSRISQRLGPSRTMEWVGDVLGALSECVLAHGGVLIDYVGDELMAMWGAPVRQEDHARRACRAALDMLARLPALNDHWREALGEATDLGIGINTGLARVGNIGSPFKFKYGPLGNTVNVASRVQGATKFLKARLLITQATHAQLDATFAARRVRRVRVVNISGPVDLYELDVPERDGWADLRAAYEKALDEFERGQFRLAARTLGPLVSESVNDGPSLVLMAHAIRHLVEEPDDFNPVWELPGK